MKTNSSAVETKGNKSKREEDVEEQEQEVQPEVLGPKRRKGQGQAKDPNKVSERIKGQLTAASKVLSTLTELTPDSIWRSLVRTNELERRLGRASSAMTEMQKVRANAQSSTEQKDAAEKLELGLQEAVDITGAIKEVARLIRNQPPVDLVKSLLYGDESELFKQYSLCKQVVTKHIPVLMDMAGAIAKKLLDNPQEARKHLG